MPDPTILEEFKKDDYTFLRFALETRRDGGKYLDIRIWNKDAKGRYSRTAKGITIGATRIERVLQIVELAQEEMRKGEPF